MEYASPHPGGGVEFSTQHGMFLQQSKRQLLLLDTMATARISGRPYSEDVSPMSRNRRLDSEDVSTTSARSMRGPLMEGEKVSKGDL